MHIQIMDFRLKDISEEGYAKLCAELAPAFAAVPGLLSEIWLANPADNRYGAVYTWEDRTAYEQFKQSGLYRVVDSHPNMKDVSSRDFEVVEGPTRATRGYVEPTDTSDPAVVDAASPDDNVANGATDAPRERVAPVAV